MRAFDPRVTFDELAAWRDDGRQYELYGGEPIVVPSPFVRHQQVVVALVNVFSRYAAEHGGLVLCSPIDIVLSQYDVLQPDVVWFGKERREALDLDAPIHGVPDLAVEVISRSTELRDRRRKKRILGRHGLPEYWVVDPVRRRLEIFSQRDGFLVLTREFDGDEAVTSPALANLQFDLDRLFDN
jgi:Uma2 family endonuclease